VQAIAATSATVGKVHLDVVVDTLSTDRSDLGGVVNYGPNFDAALDQLGHDESTVLAGRSASERLQDRSPSISSFSCWALTGKASTNNAAAASVAG